MKKLFAILVALTLVAGVSFAQVSGSVGSWTSLAGGGDDIVGGIGIDSARIALSGESDDGAFGGQVRVDFQGGSRDANASDNVRANAWWKPIDQLKIIIGQPGDGIWGKDGVTGWGFTGPAKQVTFDWPIDYMGHADGSGTFNSAFFGGTGGDSNQLHFEITPMDILGINIALPYSKGPLVEDIFAGMIAQVDVNLDFGNIALSYAGDASDATNGTMYLFVGLGIIPNVDLHVSGRFTIPGDEEDQQIGIGAGANITINDAFAVKVRVNANVGGKPDGKMDLVFDVLPSYAISDSFEIFFNLGLRMDKADEDADAIIEYVVNPYIRIGSHWGPAFRAGFRLVGSTADDFDMKWSIPIGISFNF